MWHRLGFHIFIIVVGYRKVNDFSVLTHLIDPLPPCIAFLTGKMWGGQDHAAFNGDPIIVVRCPLIVIRAERSIVTEAMVLLILGNVPIASAFCFGYWELPDGSFVTIIV